MDHPSSSPRNEAAKQAAERGVIMSVVQGGMAEPRGLEAPSPEAPAERYLGAFELLESAAKALEFLESRRDHLETALEQVSRRAEEAVAAASDRAADWQRFAADLKTRNAELERQVAALENRADQAEADAEAARNRAEAAERRAAEAQHLLRGLHDKVMSAFGQGTRAYDILAIVPEGSRKVVPMTRAG